MKVFTVLFLLLGLGTNCFAEAKKSDRKPAGIDPSKSECLTKIVEVEKKREKDPENFVNYAGAVLGICQREFVNYASTNQRMAINVALGLCDAGVDTVSGIQAQQVCRFRAYQLSSFINQR